VWFKSRYSRNRFNKYFALVGILVYTGRDFRICTRRTKNNDCKGVQDAEDRFTEAQTRLRKARKSQANLVISEIKMKL
jgi:hypothetical protein